MKEATKKYNQLQASLKRAAINLQLAKKDLSKLTPLTDTKVIDALCDDLNTPNALSALYEENKALNLALSNKEASVDELYKHFLLLYSDLGVLGIPNAYPLLSEEDVNDYREYEEAKKMKDFAKSDEIRSRLIKRNVF